MVIYPSKFTFFWFVIRDDLNSYPGVLKAHDSDLADVSQYAVRDD